MFMNILTEKILDTQAEFIRVMDANKDSLWWVKTLVTEEVKELKEAVSEQHSIADVLGECADVIYVVAGAYNCMPINPTRITSEEDLKVIGDTLQDAFGTLAHTSQQYKIPLSYMVQAFHLKHVANMSKLGDDGKPIRREDGKILKGPNYKPADYSELVAELELQWKKLESKNESEKTN